MRSAGEDMVHEVDDELLPHEHAYHSIGRNGKLHAWESWRAFLGHNETDENNQVGGENECKSFSISRKECVYTRLLVHACMAVKHRLTK